MAERDAKGRFIKGHSVKSPGRKAQPAEFKKACEELTLSALEVLKTIMLDDTQTASARIKAAEIILDRAYGKPYQAVQVDQLDTVVRIVDEDPEGEMYNV